jgi:hypothetical protein
MSMFVLPVGFWPTTVAPMGVSAPLRSILKPESVELPALEVYTERPYCAMDDGRYLYTLNAATGVIGIFAVQEDGSLVNLGPQNGLPASAGINGIAAY